LKPFEVWADTQIAAHEGADSDNRRCRLWLGIRLNATSRHGCTSPPGRRRTC